MTMEEWSYEQLKTWFNLTNDPVHDLEDGNDWDDSEMKSEDLVPSMMQNEDGKMQCVKHRRALVCLLEQSDPAAQFMLAEVRAVAKELALYVRVVAVVEKQFPLDAHVKRFPATMLFWGKKPVLLQRQGGIYQDDYIIPGPLTGREITDLVLHFQQQELNDLDPKLKL